MAFPSVDPWKKAAGCRAPARVFNHEARCGCLLSVCLQFKEKEGWNFTVHQRIERETNRLAGNTHCGFPGGSVVKNPPASAEDIRDVSSIPGSGKSPEGRAWQPTPVFLPEEFHGQRSLAGYNP